MAEPFIGQIVMFGGNFAPRGWAQCDGQLLQISQNQALFAIIGSIYGGNGETTLALPDLRGRVPIHAGQGAGLSNRSLGQKGGTEDETLTLGQMPSHNHPLQGSTDTATQSDPSAAGGNKVPAEAEMDIYTNAVPDVAMAAGAITSTGGGQPHTNVMPFQAVNFIIALTGLFPTQT